MNNTFHFNRFRLLVKRQWLEFGKIYLISLLVVTGAIIAFYFYGLPEPDTSTKDPMSIYPINSDGHVNLRFRVPLFLILGFIFISVIASGYFSLLGQKSKAIIELMTPASTFEKWLCGVLYTGILSILSFLLVFYLTDMFFVSYLNNIVGNVSYTVSSGVDQIPITTVLSVEPFYAEFFEHDEIRALALLPFMITSVFLLGSVYFNRFHYIKTAVTIMLFCTAVICLMMKIADWMTRGKVQDSIGFGFKPTHQEFLIYSIIGMATITFFLWIITFFRVKEKEV